MNNKRQVVEELHRSARKNFERRKTLMIGIDDTYQIDLVEMIPYASANKNFKYILTVIDIFSKYAWAIPMKSKAAKDATNAMNTILSGGHVPQNIHSDMGKEFFNSEFQRLMQRHHINHYTTYSTKKAAIVERFNRTLKTRMWKQLHIRGTYKWIDILQNIVDDYNNSKHRTIKMKPKNVTKADERRLLNSVYLNVTKSGEKQRQLLGNNHRHKRKLLFNVGDHVRISKYKNVFEKGYTPNWTTEIFQIVKVQPTSPITYLLKDYQNNEIKGAFYGLELQKVKHPDVYLVERILRKKDNKLLVKWLGFDNTHNSWINKSDIDDDDDDDD